MHQTNEEKPTLKLGGETETQSHHKPHPSTLTLPCPRLPGSPRIACTFTPPSPSLPGSPRTVCTHTHSALPQTARISQDCLHTWSGTAVTEAATHETPPDCLALVATGACTQMSHRNVTINQSLTGCPCSGTAA